MNIYIYTVKRYYKGYYVVWNLYFKIFYYCLATNLVVNVSLTMHILKNKWLSAIKSSYYALLIKN